MTEHIVKFVLARPEARLPERKTPGSVGWDLVTLTDVTLARHDKAVLETGVVLAGCPPGLHFLIWDRGGWGARGLHVLAGAIDGDYRGEIKVAVANLSPYPALLKSGESYVQLIPFWQPAIRMVRQFEDVTPTTRGAEGGINRVSPNSE